jgi:hypothetical protein
MKGASRVMNLPAPASDNEPARNIDLQNAVEGLKQKDPVVVRTQGNINLSSPGASSDGVTFATGNRVLVSNQTTPSQNGIYIWNGASVAITRAVDASTATELNGALVPVVGGTDASKAFRQTATITTLGTDAVTFAPFGQTSSQATETSTGIAELATQAETDTGTDDLRIVTPLKLKNWSGRKFKNGQTYGDGSTTQFDTTHNFNTVDVQIATYRVSTGERIYPKERAFDANTVRTNWTTPPATNEFRTVVTA